jgi:dienelactone hydrolase
MKTLLATLITLGCVLAARAQLHTEAVEYKDGDTTLEGYLAYDDSAAQGKRPGVLIVHQWMGLTDYEKHRAEMLAKMGYVVFAADIYGKGIRPENQKEAGAQAGKYKNDSTPVLPCSRKTR